MVTPRPKDHISSLSVPESKENIIISSLSVPESSNIADDKSDKNDKNLLPDSVQNHFNTASLNYQEEQPQDDLEILASLKKKHLKNPCIAYLNINSLRGNKFIQLKDICLKQSSQKFCV